MTSLAPLETTGITPPSIARRSVAVRELPVGAEAVQSGGLSQGGAPQLPGESGAQGRRASLAQGSPLSGESAVAAQLVQGTGGTSTEQTPTGLTQAAISRVETADGDPNALSDAEEAQVRQLRERDREVRQHEQAHARVGGQYAGPPRYEFVTGPDGRRYAVAGSVSIDVSPIPGDPEATARKAEVVRRAALAPAEPSSQDRAVAAEATELLQEARAEARSLAAEERREAITGEGAPSGEASTAPAPETAPVPELSPGPAVSTPRDAAGNDDPSTGLGNPSGDTNQVTVTPGLSGVTTPSFAPEPAGLEPAAPSGSALVNRRILNQLATGDDGSQGLGTGARTPGSLVNVSV